MKNLIGYVRVSTTDQDPQMQIEALKQAGCHKIFTDICSGSRAERPELTKCLDYLREDDVLVVWKIDRLGRSLKDLINQIEQLKERGIKFKSLQENLDTLTPSGEIIFKFFALMAEVERSFIIERTKAGLEKARQNGRVGGRPRKMTEEKIETARILKQQGKSYREIAEVLGVGRTTVKDYV